VKPAARGPREPAVDPFDREFAVSEGGSERRSARALRREVPTRWNIRFVQRESPMPWLTILRLGLHEEQRGRSGMSHADTLRG